MAGGEDHPRRPHHAVFFLTRNELAVAEATPDRFRLYRLYDFAQTRDASPKLCTLAPPLERAVTLEPETWRAGFG